MLLRCCEVHVSRGVGCDAAREEQGNRVLAGERVEIRDFVMARKELPTVVWQGLGIRLVQSSGNAS